MLGLQAAILIWGLLYKKWDCVPNTVEKTAHFLIVPACKNHFNQILEIVDLIDFVCMLVSW